MVLLVWWWCWGGGLWLAAWKAASASTLLSTFSIAQCLSQCGSEWCAPPLVPGGMEGVGPPLHSGGLVPQFVGTLQGYCLLCCALAMHMAGCFGAGWRNEMELNIWSILE